MNIKLPVFLFALLLSLTTFFYSCTSSEKSNAKEETTEIVDEVINEVIDEVSAELEQEREELKKEWDAKIEKMDARLAEIDAKIEAQGEEAPAELKERREAFHKDYTELKADLEKLETNTNTKSGWKKFKTKMKAASEKADKEVDYFFYRLGL
jgi:uncharacterized protein YicC (UPF0701 family)